MIKGINHQVIEVTDTDNRYYERALLVVRPEYASISREVLEKQARELLQKMDIVSTAKPKSVMLSRVLHSLLFLAIGALSTAVIYSFI